MSDRLAGLALFLPVPVVLFLFTRMPLGLVPSIALGTAFMVTHRFYARPFSLARAARRCLWCGGAAGDGPVLVVDEPLGRTRWRACSADHAGRVGCVLLWADRHAAFLRAGILGTLAVFLPAVLLAGFGRLSSVRVADAVAFFRLGIAVTVLPLGALALGSGGPLPDVARAPFPVHIQALIGTRGVLWLFRLIGLAWLALGAWHVWARLCP